MKLLLTCGGGLEPASFGTVVVVDWDTKQIIDFLKIPFEVYKSTPKGLSGACIFEDTLYVASEAEVFKLAMNPLRLLARATDPCFNDLHHLCVHQGRLYVCNSGLDTIEILDLEMRWIDAIPLLDFHSDRASLFARSQLEEIDYWRKRRRKVDWEFTHLPGRRFAKNVRKILTPRTFHKDDDVRQCDLRPHLFHPNHIRSVGSQVWVTRLSQGDILAIPSGRTIVEGLGRPHDGICHNGELIVTNCIDNSLIVYPVSENGVVEKEVRKVIAVTRHASEGFLRGVAADQEFLYVGLTARRKASAPNNRARLRTLCRASGAFTDEWILPLNFGAQIYSVAAIA